MAEKKIPMRMCVVCRVQKPKKELIRIVKTENGIVVDPSGKLNGRGAYICGEPECLARMKKQKALNRVFGEAVPDEVYAQVEELKGANKK